MNNYMKILQSMTEALQLIIDTQSEIDVISNPGNEYYQLYGTEAERQANIVRREKQLSESKEIYNGFLRLLNPL